jgi:hypothetical protein
MEMQKDDCRIGPEWYTLENLNWELYSIKYDKKLNIYWNVTYFNIQQISWSVNSKNFANLIPCFRSRTSGGPEKAGLDIKGANWCLFYLWGKNTKFNKDVWYEMCKKDIKCSLEDTPTLKHSS